MTFKLTVFKKRKSFLQLIPFCSDFRLFSCATNVNQFRNLTSIVRNFVIFFETENCFFCWLNVD